MVAAVGLPVRVQAVAVPGLGELPQCDEVGDAAGCRIRALSPLVDVQLRAEVRMWVQVSTTSFHHSAAGRGRRTTKSSVGGSV